MLECWNRFKKIVDATPGMTLSSVAKTAGLSSSQFTMWFKNGTIPAADKLMYICDIVGISVRWFLTGEDEDSEDPVIAKLLSDDDAYDTMLRYLACSKERRSIVRSMLLSWDVDVTNMNKVKREKLG